MHMPIRNPYLVFLAKFDFLVFFVSLALVDYIPICKPIPVGNVE